MQGGVSGRAQGGDDVGFVVDDRGRAVLVVDQRVVSLFGLQRKSAGGDVESGRSWALRLPRPLRRCEGLLIRACLRNGSVGLWAGCHPIFAATVTVLTR